MAEIINFKKSTSRWEDNLICPGPWEFRQAGWRTAHFVQMLRSDSVEFEGRRRQKPRSEEGDACPLPPHITLEGGIESTIKGIFVYRDRQDRMREVYLLAGLIDCMINQVNPVLRTALLRDMYKKVFAMKNVLGVTWHGPLDHVLLPVDPRFYDSRKYRAVLSGAQSLKGVYDIIREGTNEMFDVISREYVFYFPNLGG